MVVGAGQTGARPRDARMGSAQATGVWARFDDLSRGGHSVVLSEPIREFVAREPEQVVGLLRAAERQQLAQHLTLVSGLHFA